MTDQRRDIESVFHDARLLADAIERAAYLDKACAGDDALRAQVERLLAADGDARSLSRPHPAPPGIDSAETLATPPKRVGEEGGDRIGPYKLLQKVGEGGFGVVWVAEQREPVRRKVALKIVKAGMDTHDVLARFEAERQALAMMDHPNVAKVFDAGATDQGRPYFVMEHVPGLPITEYCDTGKLRIKERLELVIPICHAVQHAHLKGIIHRDLKPSNILVTLHDGKPVPKVIDFGIAKATSGHLTEKTLYTNVGRLMGTPEYMSPEQAGTSGLDVDTRTDVYSLGVILYELLTGTLPFDPKTLRTAGLDGMAKIIREMEPPRPSTRLGTLFTEKVNRKTGETPEEIGKSHGVPFSELRRELHGDLDWIVMKCLEKERSRRYETVKSLAQDIERHLSGEPVLAAPPSATYRLRKFVRRNKVTVVAVTAVAAALVLGVIGTTVGMVRALRAEQEQIDLRTQAESARDAARFAEANALEQAEVARLAREAESSARSLAEAEAENAKAVTRFLRGMLNSVNPSADPEDAIPVAVETGSPRRITTLDALVEGRSSAQDVTVLDMLRRSLPTIESATKDKPAVEADVRYIIGKTFWDLGFGIGLQEMEKALLAYKAAYGAEDSETLKAQVRVADAIGNPNRREEMLTPLIPILERVLGPDDQFTLGAKVLLTGAICNQRETFRDAVDELEQLSAALERLPEPRNRFTQRVIQRALRMLSEAYSDRGDTAQGVAIARRALELARAVFGPDDRDIIAAAGNLSDRLADADRLEEALVITEEDYKDRIRVFGLLPYPTRNAAWKRADLLFRLGRAEEAVAGAEKDFAELEAQGYANKDLALRWRSNMVWLFAKHGEVQRGCDFLTDLLRRAYSGRFAGFVGTWDIVTGIEWQLDQKIGEAWSECLVEDVVALAEQATREFPEDRLERYRLVELAAQVLSRRKECERAVSQAKEAYEGIIRIIGNKDDRAENAFGQLTAVFGRCGEVGDVVYLSSLVDQLGVELADDPDQLLERFYAAYWGSRRSPHFHVLGLECARRAHELAPKSKEEISKFYSINGLAWQLHLNGRTAEAEPMMRDMIQQFEQKYPNRRREILESRARLAEILAAAGKNQEAKQILSPACTEMHENFERKDEDMDTWVNLLIELHEADGEHDQAAQWRTKLDPQAGKKAQR